MDTRERPSRLLNYVFSAVDACSGADSVLVHGSGTSSGNKMAAIISDVT